MSGHRQRVRPARDRIVSRAMMGGVGFILFKAGNTGPESARQAEICLARLPKILHNGPSLERRPREQGPRTCHGCGGGGFPDDMANFVGIISSVI
jgi:hypothetical protein